MAWENGNLSNQLKEKIRDLVWSNLSSRRFMAQTADLYTDKILSVIIAMLGGKERETEEEKQNKDIPLNTTTESEDLDLEGAKDGKDIKSDK